jgi:CheY-like chemotaxis protein
MRLLYVEDNRINALLFEEALRTQAHVELRVAENGAQALSIARDWHPEVLVLDSHLPDTSGLELLPKLRALPGLAAAPAFMCSADAMYDEVQRALSAGLEGYWTKPIDFDTVFADLLRVAAELKQA